MLIGACLVTSPNYITSCSGSSGYCTARLPLSPFSILRRKPGMRRPGGIVDTFGTTPVNITSMHCAARTPSPSWPPSTHPPTSVHSDPISARLPPHLLPHYRSTLQDNPRGFNTELLRLCGVDVDPAAADAAYAATRDAVAQMAAAAAAEEAEG